jgi:hypothetical protein
MSQQAPVKTYARRLTESEVLGILDQRERMAPADIARLYQISPVTVGRILRGESYREMTHLSHPDKQCMCPSCGTARLGEETVEQVRATQVTVPCTCCKRPTAATVARVLGQRGLVLCPKCDGRKH